MDNKKLDELERVARALTYPDDWHTEGRNVCSPAGFVVAEAHGSASAPDELMIRATYIAAFDPPTTLALITAARRPALPDREAVAREVYNTFSDQEGFVPWVEGGNSDKQFEARRVANRIIALSPAQAERDGWVLVPREPTEAMLQPACAKHTPGAPMRLPHEQWRGTEECPSFAKRRRIWASMLSAAPKEEPDHG